MTNLISKCRLVTATLFAMVVGVIMMQPLAGQAETLNGGFCMPTDGPATPENTLIKLRDAMKGADVPTQKALLVLVGHTGTFQGLMFAGTFLDNKNLQAEAAEAVAQIALEHKDYDGTAVRTLLDKAVKRLKGETKAQVKEMLKTQAPKGFVSMFNGENLEGWKGLVENPIKRAAMTAQDLAVKQVKADSVMRCDWKVENGMIVYEGHGYENLCSAKEYKDFEMYVDWLLDPNGKEPDAGIYLRGTPQVQIWDTSRVNVGAQVGSGGLYNNKENVSVPSCVADNGTGIWNSFCIRMVGDRVTVLLNGIKVVDNVVLENYWDRKQQIFPLGQIELQAHGSRVCYRDLYIKELE